MTESQMVPERTEALPNISATLLCYLLTNARARLAEALAVAEDEAMAMSAIDARCARIMGEIGELTTRLRACDLTYEREMS